MMQPDCNKIKNGYLCLFFIFLYLCGMKRFALSVVTLCIALLTAFGQTWQYVDPRIGTVGVGRTFPGPCMPFGMAKPGPDCGVQPNAGWAPMPEGVSGFSQTHVSGTGGGQKYGNILIAPIPSTAEKGIAQRRKDETIALGYYSTTFESGIRTEITAAERSAFYRFHYPAKGFLFVDATHFLGKDSVPDLRERQQVVGAEVELVSDREVRGYSRVRGGWNNGEAYTVYFSLLADSPFSAEAEGATALLHFQDTLVNVSVGISYVSTMQARRNIDDVSFDTQLSRLREAWQRQLGKVLIDGTEAQKRMFYTALYHTMLMPVDKSALSPSRPSENPKWTETPYYDDYYAIWDTYRTSSPLLTLIDQPRQVEMVQSLLNIYLREGYLPDARSGDCNGRTQGGSCADIVIADAFAKRLGWPSPPVPSAALPTQPTPINYELALEAMLKDGEQDPGADHEKHGRGGLTEYQQLGYVPYGIDRAGTRTVEYAFCDWCIAQVAQGLGYDEIAKKYEHRSRNWRNLWRADYEYDGMQGFIMPKDEQGQWLDSVPWGNRSALKTQLPTHVIPYTPTTKVAPWYVPWWSTFFYEATSEEYSLSIPHDVDGLIEACGGPEAFRQRLDLFFEKGYYNVENEPSFLTPCLYHWIGRPDLSSQRIHQIIRDNYSDQPDGLPGNDDSGAMSSWLAFHMMGLYPLAGTPYYLVNVPIVKEATLTLPNGNRLSIYKKGKGQGFASATFNGQPLSGARITHQQLMQGGELCVKCLALNSLPEAEKSVKAQSDNHTFWRGAEGEAAGAIHFTLNRQQRTWPFVYGWQGDTLVVQCKQTIYMIPRHEAASADHFCWLNPQVDGTVHHDARGTFCFISQRAFEELRQTERTTYEGITWHTVGETPAAIRVRAEQSRTEMWISKTAPLPLVLKMSHNPLGIDWTILQENE